MKLSERCLRHGRRSAASRLIFIFQSSHLFCAVILFYIQVEELKQKNNSLQRERGVEKALAKRATAFLVSSNILKIF